MPQVTNEPHCRLSRAKRRPHANVAQAFQPAAFLAAAQHLAQGKRHAARSATGYPLLSAIDAMACFLPTEGPVRIILGLTNPNEVKREDYVEAVRNGKPRPDPVSPSGADRISIASGTGLPGPHFPVNGGTDEKNSHIDGCVLWRRSLLLLPHSERGR